jgi:hypothetical protein
MRKLINVLFMAISFSLVVLCMGCENLPDLHLPAPTTEGAYTKPTPVEPPSKPSLPESEIIELYSPEWFRNVPEEPGYIYAAAVDQHWDSSTAEINAKIKAHAKISMRVKERYRAFLTEAGVDPGKSISRVMPVGIETVDIEKIKEEERFYAYVLMRISDENVKASIVTMIEDNEELYAKLKESPKFKELMEETKDVEKE